MTASLFAQVPSTPRTGAFRLFIVAALLTAAWLALNAAFPSLYATGIPLTVIRLAVHMVMLSGLWLGLARTELSYGMRVRTWLAVAIPLTAWLVGIWILAIGDAFMPDAARIPLLPLAILVPILIGLAPMLLSNRIGVILDATPPAWLVGLQVYRVIGGISLVGWAAGEAPAVFALPAGLGDILVGLMALPTAFYLSVDASRGRRAALAWNLLGLVDLTIAVTMGALSSPGPLQLLALDHPNLFVSAYPTVMVPAFAVPVSIILHGLSLRQLRRGSREAGLPR